jgi:hypothetical protein
LSGYSHGDALGGCQIRFISRLDQPSGGDEQFVNFGTRFLLGSH